MNTSKEQYRWLYLTNLRLPSRIYSTQHTTLSSEERTRIISQMVGLSPDAKRRLDWMLHYAKRQNVSLTCRHFGIARKVFYKWLHRFNHLNLYSLEGRSRAPLKRRLKEYTILQYTRVVALRRARIRYGKEKLLALYQGLYPDDPDISLWKVQSIIERAGIYYNPQKQGRINAKRQRALQKKRITQLQRIHRRGFLLCLDTIVVYWKGSRRYIRTAIDRFSKVAFARMYTTNSSASAADFLSRLHYLLDGKIENIQTDNGSEFQKHFGQLCLKLSIPHYFSRVHTPKDNAVNERFNRTIQEEFLALGNMTLDTDQVNRRMTEWLIEYNFRRPHYALKNMPPINFSFKYHKVLPMYPSSTLS
jgi:transposase InsO family protein